MTDANHDPTLGVPIEDIFVAALPDVIAMDWKLGKDRRMNAMAWLDYHARLKVMTQWVGEYPVPKDINIQSIDWLVTDSAHDAKQFTPAHDCDDCRAGLVKGAAYLEDNPGSVVSFANIKYSVIW